MAGYLTERDKCDILDEFDWELPAVIQEVIDLREKVYNLESKLEDKDDRIEELEGENADLQKELDAKE